MPSMSTCKCGKPIRKGKTGLCWGCRYPGSSSESEIATTSESVTETATTREIQKTVTEKVRTLDDLIRVCEIDTDEWTVERWTCGKHETSMKLETRGAQGSIHAGKILESRPHVEEAFTIKVWLKRRSAASVEMAELRRGLVEDIRAEVTNELPRARPYNTAGGGWLFEFAPFDLHMGKYTWDEETVTNYDADHAEELFNASLDFLLDRAMKLTDGKIDKVLCVFGNDVSHSDNKRGTTTAGTPLDMDTRYIRVYRKICAIHRRAVDILRGIAPVHIAVVPGNHDELTSFHLGEILAERYDGNRHVTVDNSARMRKYFEWGTNLFGFTHGDSENVRELPLAMAREVPDMWARCESREWHIGHLHIGEKWSLRHPAFMSQDLVSDKGVRIRRLNSMSGHDAWHTKHAYMDRRSSDAFVFHEKAGFTADLSFNVDHFSGRPLKAE